MPKKYSYARRTKKTTRIEGMEKTKDGQWKVSYRINNIRRHEIFQYKYEAQRFVDHFLDHIKGKKTLLSGPQENPVRDITLAKAFFEHIEEKLEMEAIAESTYKTKRTHFITCIPDKMKDLLLSEIDNNAVKEIREFNKFCRDGTKSNGTKFRSAMVELKQIKKWANENGYQTIPANLKDTKAEVKKRDLRTTYSLEEYYKVVAFFDNPKNKVRDRKHAAILALNINLGLRIGELCALEFFHFDLKNRTVDIERTLTRDKSGKLKIGDGTKSRKNRTVSFGKKCLEFIDYIKKATASPREAKVMHAPDRNPASPWLVRIYQPKRLQPNNYPAKEKYFSTKEEAEKFAQKIRNFDPEAEAAIDNWLNSGEARFLVQRRNTVTPTQSQIYVLNNWKGQTGKGVLSKIGIPYLPSHNACRRTMATILATEMKDQNMFSAASTIQKRLGHKKVSMTMDNYIKPLDLGREEVEDVFERDKTPPANEGDSAIQVLNSLTEKQKSELKKLLNQDKGDKEPA